VNFAWRWGKRLDQRAEAAGGVAELTPTDHDYPQYLGPLRLAVLPQAKLARDWERRPPRLVWRRSIGAGWGAFAIVGEYAFTQEQHGEQECTVCYRAADGGIVWVRSDQA